MSEDFSDTPATDGAKKPRKPRTVRPRTAFDEEITYAKKVYNLLHKMDTKSRRRVLEMVSEFINKESQTA